MEEEEKKMSRACITDYEQKIASHFFIFYFFLQ